MLIDLIKTISLERLLLNNNEKIMNEYILMHNN